MESIDGLMESIEEINSQMDIQRKFEESIFGQDQCN